MLNVTKSPIARALPKAAERPEGAVIARYSYIHGEHELLLTMPKVGDRERAALRTGEVEFALMADGPLVLIGARLGEAIPWSVASFCWHHLPREARVPPPIADSPAERRIPLVIALTESEGGTVRDSACVTLPLDFTRALNDAIRDQSRVSFDPTDQLRALADFRRRCPTPRAMVARANCRAFGSR